MEMNSHDDIFLAAMQAEKEKQGKKDKDFSPVKHGKVVQISDNDVFLDMGGKSEAVVPKEEFKTVPELGAEIAVVFTTMKDGVHQASWLAAQRFARQDEIRKAFEEDLPIKGRLIEIVKKDNNPKGFRVEIGLDTKAFLPLSHIDTRRYESLEAMLGEEFEFSVIEMRRDNVTVSRRQYLRKTIKKLFTAFFEAHQIGDIVSGTVDEIDQNYLIMTIEGIKAFLHISDFSWKYLNDLKKLVKRGDEFEVKIISLDPSKDSVKVSKKALMPNPWDNVEERIHTGDVLQAKVVRFRRDAAIVEVEDGVEAFLPVSEMSWTQKVRDPRHILKNGDIVEVKVKNIDSENKRLEVSLRAVQPNPWDEAEEKYTVGRKLEGEVSSVLEFGVFVRFDDGIDGLLRKEDVDWLNADVDLKEKFKKKEKIQVVVLSIDVKHEKLRLGIKQMSDNPFKSFSMNYPKGSVVEGTVKEVLDNGINVSLENNLVGFVHVSNLSKEKVEKPSDRFKEGDKIKALVKFTDVAKQNIELSIKDFEYHEEKKEVNKYIVNDSDNGQSTTMGSILAEQFKGLKLADEKPKKKATKKAKAKAKKEETIEVDEAKEAEEVKKSTEDEGV